MVLVPSHRASSLDAVASGELPCSFLLEVSELVPAQPTTRTRTAHPSRKATTAMRCAWRTTTAPRLLLPASKDRVGQDARPEQQRGRRQNDGRTTARRDFSRTNKVLRKGGAINHRRLHNGGRSPAPIIRTLRGSH